MKIYLVTVDDICDGEIIEQGRIPYLHYEDAKEKFEKLIKSYEHDCPDIFMNDEQYSVNRDKDFFSAYERGNYTLNHIDIEISELEVK